MPAQGVWRTTMAEQAVRTSVPAPAPERTNRWRTVDIVVAVVLGVAFGVVFWAWTLVAGVAGPPLDFFPPIKGLLNGVFLMPGVVAGLLIRKPGAAVFASTLPAAGRPLLGSPHGGGIRVFGLVPGPRGGGGLPRP